MHALRRTLTIVASLAMFGTLAAAPAFAGGDEDDDRRSEIAQRIQALKAERDDALELLHAERQLVHETYKANVELLKLDLEDALDAIEEQRDAFEAGCETAGCSDEEYEAGLAEIEMLVDEARAAFHAAVADERAAYRDAMAELRAEMRAVREAFRDGLAALRAELRALRHPSARAA